MKVEGILIVLLVGFSGCAAANLEGSVNTLSFDSPEKEERHISWYREYFLNGLVNRNWTEEDEFKGGEMQYGMFEVTRYPDSEPSFQQAEGAWDMYTEAYNAVLDKGWGNYSKALEDGFDFNTDPIHHGNREYLFDNETLNPEKPEYLMFYNVSGEMKLAGIMYLAPNITAKPKQPGGPITMWHYHRYGAKLCFEKNVLLRPNWDCEVSDADRTPEMIHVWFIDHPRGQFASRMSVGTRHLKYQNLRKLSREEFLRKEVSRYIDWWPSNLADVK